MNECLIDRLQKYFRGMTATKLMVLGYSTLILLGGCLLMLPPATRDGQGASLKDAMFTAASATCVTGMTLHDTYHYWSLFGQLIQLVLVELGGLGFMSVMTFLLSFTKRKIGVKQRFVVQEAYSAPQVGGIVRMTQYIFFSSLAIELAGAALLCIYYCPRLGALRGIYFSVFHSVSAFCNAGIDLMGYFSPGSSLMTGAADPFLNAVFMILIVIGGLGFFVWFDVIEHRHHFSKYRLHTKLVLVTSGVLILLGTVLIFLLERGGAAMEDCGTGQTWLRSLFQSVTCRTAGFFTVDMRAMTEGTQFVCICLMLIGGSSGSTAGGLKTTTLALLFMSITVVFRKRKTVECFHRRIEEEAIHNACCVLMLYLLLLIASSVSICAIEGVGLVDSLFECSAALGTAGLTLGLTPRLSALSQVILMFLMFVGRVGGLSVLLALSNTSGTIASQYPLEKVTVG